MAIKMVYCLVRKPGLSREEFQDYWFNIHWLKVREYAAKIHMVRYSQSHTYSSDMGDAVANERGKLEAYDGVMEGWWESEEDAIEAMQNPEGLTAMQDLLDDERKFIDFSKSPVFLTNEYVLISNNEIVG